MSSDLRSESVNPDAAAGDMAHSGLMSEVSLFLSFNPHPSLLSLSLSLSLCLYVWLFGLLKTLNGNTPHFYKETQELLSCPRKSLLHTCHRRDVQVGHSIAEVSGGLVLSYDSDV